MTWSFGIELVILGALQALRGADPRTASAAARVRDLRFMVLLSRYRPGTCYGYLRE
jgi:hypothetical protein